MKPPLAPFSEPLDEPRFVDRGDVTDRVFKSSSKILEINSKSGLYPLYVAYSIYRRKCGEIPEQDIAAPAREKKWRETVRDNVFVICKTPMAASITRRTLVGYSTAAVNTVYVENLIDTLKDTPEKFIKKITKGNFWKREEEEMKFDAVVGNPPYQQMDGGAQASAKPMYHLFVQAAKALSSKYVSMIMPARWYAGGKGLDEFRDEMLSDSCIKLLVDFKNPDDVFPNTNIRSGVCYFLRDKDSDVTISGTRVVTVQDNKIVSNVCRPLKYKGVDIFIRDARSYSILGKIKASCTAFVSEIVSARKPFGFQTDFYKTNLFKETKNGMKDPLQCVYKGCKVGYVERKLVSCNHDWIDQNKVLIPRANNIGTELNDDNLNAFIYGQNVVCTESYLVVGGDLHLTRKGCVNLVSYLQTRFARFMHSLMKASQDATSKTFQFVPMQDFSEPWDDAKLYKKYKLTREEIAFIESMIKPME